MDIGKGSGGVAGRLSNFTPRKFIFDGVECCSIEGVLQSFKFKNPEMQKEICKLSGLGAKQRGASKNWRQYQKLYWNPTANNRTVVLLFFQALRRPQAKTL